MIFGMGMKKHTKPEIYEQTLMDLKTGSHWKLTKGILSCDDEMHGVGTLGKWQGEELFRAHEADLIYSRISEHRLEDDTIERSLDYLVFRINGFVTEFDGMGYSAQEVRVWGKRRQNAVELLDSLRSRFLEVESGDADCAFHMLVIRDNLPELYPVQLRDPAPQTDLELALHYGEDFCAWRDEFLQWLNGTKSKAAILRGEPGTGKTTFLRHAIRLLGRSHRFYCVPSSQADLLTRPAMLPFWIHERKRHEGKKPAVIIEDAERLLASRLPASNESLSNLLNIADGLLGECLGLHLIFTINCEADELDPAALRPGRLGLFRDFRKLDHGEATKLATHIGVELPRLEDGYSLGEIYSGPPKLPELDKELGFHAA